MNLERPAELSRRRFLCVSSAAVAAALTGIGPTGCGDEGMGGPEPDPTPAPIAPAKNLVVFIADDWRADVLGHLGHPIIRTPNFDRLAQEGVSATRLFSVAMDCQPARVSLFSSLYAKTHGVRDNQAIVPESILFLAEVLRDAGFATGGFGKLHDGTGAGQGLQEVKPFLSVDSPFYTQFIQWDNRAIESGRSGLDADECPTHTITSDGISFIRKNAGKRFFALISIPEPHPPYIAPDPYYSRIDPGQIQVRTFAESQQFWKSRHPGWSDYYRQTWASVGRESLQRALATYYAKIEFLDAELGRLRSALEQEGLLDQTAVVILSDHGEMAGLGGVMGKSGMMADPVLREPLIIRYPPLATALRSAGLMESVDVGPTLLSLLGVPIPSSFEGHASERMLQGSGKPKDDAISVLPDLGTRMVRTARYKLIVYGGGFQELYDLDSDPGEELNIAQGADPALLQDLTRRLQRAG
jgi:arylsulfatase A-like enzyme